MSIRQSLLSALSILLVLLICSCDDDDNNSSGGGGTPVFRNIADTLEGIYTVSYRTGATVIITRQFNTQITASKTVKNEFTFSKVEPYNKPVPALLRGNDIAIDTIYDTTESIDCNGMVVKEPFTYYGSGTILDSIIEFEMVSGNSRTDYELNLNK